jgi:ATP-binding cassette subfamily G (WHITE) protein 2 (PDR)
MSLVGNFTFGNYDGQNQRSGVGALGGNANNRDHHMDQADNSHRATHLNPQHSTQQPSQSQDTASRQTSHTMTTQKLDPSHTGTGIHDGTYYPDGITPSDEKTELEPAESPTSSQSEAAYDRDEKVHDIARTLSRTMSQAPDDPFTYEEDSPLNPNGPNFKARIHNVRLVLRSRT